MPQNWSLSIAHWAFITTEVDEDYWLGTPDGMEVNATTTTSGLSTVTTEVAGVHAFDFAFSSKPTYQIENLTEPEPRTSHTYPVVYEALSVNDEEFVNLVSGMTQLIGELGQLLLTYAINQTNQFINGIPFEEAWDNFEPNSTAALLVITYPEYGRYQGGQLTHDPIYIAYYTAEQEQPIPGFPLILICFTLLIVCAVTIRFKKPEFKSFF